jgi:hypothetical protein
MSYVAVKAPLAPDKVRAIFDRVNTRQRQVGFDCDYTAWMARVTPPDLE